MTLSGRDFGIAVAAFFFIALPGCKQILDLNERSAAEPTTADDGGKDSGTVFMPVAGSCGSIRHPTAACAACMDANCCDQAMACRGDPACDPAYDCHTTCGDDAACRARCNTFFTRAETLIDINACRETKCRAECALSCGGFGYPAPTCGACVKQTCCGIATDCAKNPACVKLDVCRSSCLAGSMDCPPECERKYADGVNDLAPWLDCVQNQCGDACQTGRNWACLDAKVPWLKPKSAGEIKFTITIVDIVGEHPFVGTIAKACSRVDLNCSMPLDTEVTNQEGSAELTVQAGSLGFDGYIDLKGGDNGAGAPIFPAIWYPVPNIVASGSRGRVQFVSTESLKQLAGLTGAIIDPARGHFAAAAQDCNFTAAGGVTFDVDTKDTMTTVFYFIGGVPKTNATQTDPVTGIGGYINLPVDRSPLALATARVQVGDEIRTIGSPTYIIRAGTFTTTSIPPIP
jgi:hypothetical protein